MIELWDKLPFPWQLGIVATIAVLAAPWVILYWSWVLP